MRKFKAIAAIVAVAIFGLFATANHAAAVGDPVVTATCDATVVVNTPVNCTVTIDQVGYAPSNQRITYRTRSGSTINVANESVIPVTFDGVAWHYTYVPSTGEVGRFEVFSVSTACTRLGCRVGGSAGFTVRAA